MSAHARIQVTLEIDAGGGSWDSSCSVAEVFEQGKRAALENLRRALESSRVSARVLGEPKVLAIITEDT